MLKEETVELASKADAACRQVVQSQNEFNVYKRKATLLFRSLKSHIAALADQIQQIDKQEGRILETPWRLTPSVSCV